MALVQCAECSGQLSDKASACPHCGAPAKPALVPCAECGQKISRKALACPKCGSPTSNAVRVPEHAGYAQVQRPSAAQQGVTLVKTARSRGLFVVLGLFLGCLGIHNFYAGYYGRGTAQLIITLALGYFIIGPVITAVWALIEIIAVSVDADGHKMA